MALYLGGGAAVWSPRCKLKSSKNVLDSFQRIILGGMVVFMRTAQRTACEVILEVPPLDLWIRGAALMTLCHIKENCRTSHHFDWELAGELYLEPPIAMDGCTRKCFFSEAYVVHLAERKD